MVEDTVHMIAEPKATIQQSACTLACALVFNRRTGKTPESVNSFQLLFPPIELHIVCIVCSCTEIAVFLGLINDGVHGSRTNVSAQGLRQEEVESEGASGRASEEEQRSKLTRVSTFHCPACSC